MQICEKQTNESIYADLEVKKRSNFKHTAEPEELATFLRQSQTDIL